MFIDYVPMWQHGGELVTVPVEPEAGGLEVIKKKIYSVINFI